LRFGSSLPARAKRSVVFPEPGGPKSNVILRNAMIKYETNINIYENEQSLTFEINKFNLVLILTYKVLQFH
jgi:hypothetical protein